MKPGAGAYKGLGDFGGLNATVLTPADASLPVRLNQAL
jgi:hypothetical protein